VTHEMTAWAERVFGSVDAYKRALPSREWHRLGNGRWFRSDRGAAAEQAAERAAEWEFAE
jgi:hypothetical protein